MVCALEQKVQPQRMRLKVREVARWRCSGTQPDVQLCLKQGSNIWAAACQVCG